jgi:hypothetical protein
MVSMLVGTAEARNLTAWSVGDCGSPLRSGAEPKGVRVRYQRQEGMGTDPGTNVRLRIAALVTVSLVVIGVVVGIVVGSTGSNRPEIDSGPAARAVSAAFLQASVLMNNLGSPAPAGVTAINWDLIGDPIVDRGTAHAHLSEPEVTWPTTYGVPNPISAARAAAIGSHQRALLANLFTGSLLADQEGQLSSILKAEEQSPPTISSPGGARIVQWFTRRVTGHTATVEAVVEDWSQIDSLSFPLGKAVLSKTLSTGEVDAKATLECSGGKWRLVTLARPPWQEAT